MYKLKIYHNTKFHINWLKKHLSPKVADGHKRSNFSTGQSINIWYSKYQISHHLVKNHQTSPKVKMVIKGHNVHQRSISTFGKIFILKIKLHTKFHINWLKQHQRSNISFGQICIHIIYLHIKYHINWLKINHRTPKVTKGQFIYLVRYVYIV